MLLEFPGKVGLIGCHIEMAMPAQVKRYALGFFVSIFAIL